MRLAIVYGTRPEYLKILPIMKLHKFKVIRILQHADISEPDLYSDVSINLLQTSENRLDCIGSEILLKLGNILKEDNITHLIVQGDTSTAFYSALSAFQNNIKIVHLEAGLRTYDITRPYPEEGYRQMISRLTDIHFVPHEYNKQLLETERVSGRIYTVGNTILDLVKEYNLTVTSGNNVLITFHRRENVQYLDSFVRNLRQCIQNNTNKNFLWILHPNPQLQALVKHATTDLNVNFIQPCEHREFLNYLKDCFCILTDSGGIQEEASFLGKPTIVLRDKTERDQIPEPYLYLVKPQYDELNDIFSRIPQHALPPCYVYGKGDTSSTILTHLS
jgi:UDP-N-acetylglucosamine 2-epimerase (non-hydrolysing)